jgi:predicted amidohydrolase
MTPGQLTIAAIQLDASPALLARRLERAEYLITEAARQGAQVIVLPEVFNTGYEYNVENYRRAEPLTGPTVTWMKAVAARLKVFLAGSLLLRDGPDIYNSLLLVAPGGQIWRYDKNFPWMWERAYFRPGNSVTVAETPVGRFGMLICADVAQPRLWARYAGKVNAMLVSSCPPYVPGLEAALPNGQTAPLGPAMHALLRGIEDTFGRQLLNQSAWLGVPVVNTTATGKFSSHIPRPRLSLALYSLAQPGLLRYIARADQVRLESGYYQETFVADATGKVLARVPAASEGLALGAVMLSDSPPQPQGQQPTTGLSPLVFWVDRLTNRLMAQVYQRQVSQFESGWGQ